MDEQFFDEEAQRIQKAINEHKKRELEEKDGASFGGKSSDLPPEIESQWLDNIEEFERQFENAERVSVNQFLDFPSFRPVSEIPPELVAMELARIQDLLSQHGIEVDCVAEVSDADLYTFITTELINQEVDDIRIDGWMQHFIYEDFHPNDEYDAKSAANDFVRDLFERRESFLFDILSGEEIYDPQGCRITREDAMKLIRTFYSRFAVFTSHAFECIGCTLDGDYAKVTLHGEWSGLDTESMTSLLHKGVSELRMKKNGYGGYDVIQAIIPGFAG